MKPHPLAIFAISWLLISCGGKKKEEPAPLQPNAWALTAKYELLGFRVDDPAKIITRVPITGTPFNEPLVALDMRLADGALYVSSRHYLYKIDLATGSATLLNSSAFGYKLYSVYIGADFNPVADEFRIVGNEDENIRVKPGNGVLLAADGAIQPSVLMVTAAAYSNNFKGATTTTLYHITTSGVLVRQREPPTGWVTAVGQMGIANLSTVNGFDIAGKENKAYAALTTRADMVTKLYRIDLQTGAATAVGTFPESIAGLALALDL